MTGKKRRVRMSEKLSGVEKILWGRATLNFVQTRGSSSRARRGSAGNERGGDLT